jgi:hypothetical protein
MTQKTNKPRGDIAPESAGFRQVIFSAVALGIIGLGVWSMWSQSAPYHPESVTRGPVDLNTVD